MLKSGSRQSFRPTKCSLRGAAVFFALVILLGAIGVAAHGSRSLGRQRQAAPPAPPPVSRTFALLVGIPQQGAVLGYPNAPVTLQFFGDLQCIDSRRVMLGALPFLIRHWVREGKLQIRFRAVETDTRAAGGWYEFREQQTAALAAGRQGKFWNFIDVFYREQGPERTGYVDEAFLNRIGTEAGLNLRRWSDDIVPFQNTWVKRSETDKALALAKDLESTPSFLIGRTGGPALALRHFSLEEPKVFDEAIRKLL
jgi:protein-disulfide isomerase